MISDKIPLGPRGVGHTAAAGPVLSAPLSRAGTKLLFRFTDDARSRLDRLCPEPSSGPKVPRGRVHTYSGECYAVTANGWLERRQLEVFAPNAQPPTL